MTRHRLLRRTFGALVLIPWTFACAKKEEPAPSAASAASTPNAAASLAEPASGAGGSGSPSTCHVTAEKIWTKTPSSTAGLTATVLDDGRVALGTLLDGKPYVIVVNTNGESEETAVALGKDLREQPKDKAKRVIARVTPAVGSGGSVIAFADYRETSDKRRRVSCGPTDSTRKLVEFDGKPLIEEKPEGETPAAAKETPPKSEPVAAATPSAATPPTSEKSPPKAEATASAATPAASAASAAPAAEPRRAPMLRGNTEKELKRLKALRDRLASRRASEATQPTPSATEAAPAPKKETAPESPKKEAKKTESAGKEKVRELRDCRTFVDRGGEHAWAVGSELVGDEQKDGTMKYGIVFFVQRELGRGRLDLHTVDLGVKPEDIPLFEVPSAFETAPGSFLLAARHRGMLLVWSLDADKRPRGGMRSFGGGYPTTPQVASDGAPLLLLSQRVAGGHYELRYARMDSGGALPPQLSPLKIPGKASSLSDPHLVTVGNQRWLSYRAGDHTPNGLRLSPVSDRLWPESTAIVLAEPTEQVTDSQLFSIGKNRLLAAYIRAAAGKPQLVTKLLDCG